MSESLINLVANNPSIGLLLSFLFAFLEALPIIGTFIPGIALMSISGYWIGANLISFYSTLFFCFIGALLGDYISYWIGLKYQSNIYNIKYFKDKTDYIDKAKNFVEHYGALAIILGRFFGPVRSCVPLIAGLLSLNKIKFTLGAVPSAFLWSLVYLSPGIIYGSAAMFLPKIYFNLILYYGVMALLITFYYRYQYEISKKITSLINNTAKLNLSLYSIWILLNTLVSWGLLYLIWSSVIHGSGISTINQPIYYFLQSIRTTQLDYIMYLFTLFGEANFIIPWTIIWFLYLSRHQRWNHIQHYITIVFLTFILTQAIKLFASIERPPIGNIVAITYSFPSGHTAIVVAIMSSLRWSCSYRKSTAAFLPSLFYTTIILLTGFSRLYLGMHWLTDVIAAFLLVHPTILITDVLINKYKQIKFKNMFSLFALTISITFLCSSIMFKTPYKNTHSDSLFSRKIQLYNSKPLELPLTYYNRTHTYRSPLNVQILGSIEQFDQSIQNLGWSLNVKNGEVIKPAIINEQDIQHQLKPLLEPLVYYRRPIRIYTWVTHQKYLYVLRIWETPYNVNKQPLYLGSSYIDYTPNQPHMWLNPHRVKYDISPFKSLKLKTNTYQITKDLPVDSDWSRDLIVVHE